MQTVLGMQIELIFVFGLSLNDDTVYCRLKQKYKLRLDQINADILDISGFHSIAMIRLYVLVEFRVTQSSKQSY